jgi:group II intron reverse transcriptase/maturase
MIETVLNARNLMTALNHVRRNKGSAGVDGMTVDELYAHFSRNREAIAGVIREGQYCPQAILGVEIPKDNGKMRLLGIPTVMDRMLQQAVGQAIAIKFETEFEDQSYGLFTLLFIFSGVHELANARFRPNRNAQKAVQKAFQYINEGYAYIVDIDLQTFFDEVDHSILLHLLFRKIKCGLTLRLIRKWLKAPILIDGKLHKRRKGVPQGSPLSPLLSNIMLHELDKELNRQGLRFVRYADDFSIYCRSREQARKAGNATYLFLKNKLKLPINREKSGIRKPVNFNILGYGLVPTYEKGKKGVYQLVVAEKSWKKLKYRLKEVTRKTKPYSFDRRMEMLKEVQRGWLQYFRMANISTKLKTLDGWLRNRIRYCIWSRCTSGEETGT